MKKRHNHDEALAAEYALGTLRGNARLRFEARQKTDKILAKKVGDWQTLLSGLDNHIIPVIPPETVWKRISLSLPERHSWRTRVLTWGVAAGILLMPLTTWYTLRPLQMTPLTVLSGSQQGQWVVSTDQSRKILSITPVSSMIIASNKSYELWIIRAGKKPQSLGLLNEKEMTQLGTLKGRLITGDIIAISLEPHGGSPTSQPTGPIMFVGKITI